jgi:hypothetical protein
MNRVSEDKVAIEEFLLIDASGTKKASIAHQLMSFTIEEDITNSFIEAQINMLDGIGLISTFPIVGEEKIQIKLTKTTLDKKEEASYNLFVYAIDNLNVSENNTAQSYVLRAVSEELLISGSTQSRKAYLDKYENIVRDILTNDIKTTKNISIGSTYGTHQIVIPGLKPFVAIDMVRKRATSSKNPYSPVMFFETKNGYFLHDIVDLFDQRKSAALGLQYYNTAVPNKDPLSIISFSAPEKNNAFHMINDGSIKNQIQQYDLITKTLTLYDFDLKDKLSSFNLFNSPKNHSTDFIEKYTGKTSAVEYFVPIDSTKPNPFIDRFGERHSYINMIMQNYSKLETVGSLKMQAGDVLNLKFAMQTIVTDPAKPTNSSKHNDRKIDESLSGYYMIKKIIHEVLIAGGAPPTHRVFCDLIRGSTIGKLT